VIRGNIYAVIRSNIFGETFLDMIRGNIETK